MPNAVAWALVADAWDLRRRGHAGCAAWRVTMSAPDNPASQEHATGRPGLVHESVGSARHAIERRQAPHRAVEASFARHLANGIEKAAATGRHASLLLAGPPNFLGDLRKALGTATLQPLRGSPHNCWATAGLPLIVHHLDEVCPA